MPTKLDRRAVVAELLRERGDALVIAGLGAPSWDCTAAGDHPLTFPLWGAMGSAAMIGLGLAIAQPKRRVLVITGDGEILMGLGSLATVAVQQPKNLAVVVLDNERYGETGMQKTHTAYGVDLAKTALACGFVSGTMVTSKAELTAMRARIYGANSGPSLFQVKVRDEQAPLVLPPREGAHLKNRFRSALLGEAAHR
jgi:thiamine pyrophosphate-dependent acetolactate synthase large subunit-like protein